MPPYQWKHERPDPQKCDDQATWPEFPCKRGVFGANGTRRYRSGKRRWEVNVERIRSGQHGITEPAFDGGILNLFRTKRTSFHGQLERQSALKTWGFKYMVEKYDGSPAGATWKLLETSGRARIAAMPMA